MERIASLLPSATEIACALGCADQLVGRSHECDHPATVANLPVLTAPKLDAGADSRAIDDRVRQLVSEGLSVYRVDAERLRALQPTLILTQDHCEVCAASPRDLDDALSGWMDPPPRVISLDATSLGDVWRDIASVAEALGCAGRGRELNRSLATRISEVAERSQALRPRPSVACLEWIDPLMAAGNWMPELVTLAGGRPLLAEGGRLSPWISLGDLAASDPDVIVMLPCGFDLKRTRQEMSALTGRAGWQTLRAVREGRVHLTDGNAYFNRPGPRLVESLEILAEILQPEPAAAKHLGTGWQPL
jgi:iron complex transport system substrate-binding protein